MGILDRAPADSTGRRLSTFQVPDYARTREPTQLAWLGDSLPSYGEGMPYYVEAISKQKHRFTSPNGVNRVKSYPGQDTAYLLTQVGQITSLTGSDKPTHCIVNGGTNDTIGATGLATTMANLEAIFVALEAVGIRPILHTLPPLGGTFQYSTKKGPAQRINVLLRDNAIRTGRWIVDPYTVLVDLVTAASGYLAAYDSGDNVHPSPAGIQTWAQKIVTDLAVYSATPYYDPLVFGAMGSADGQLYASGLYTAGGGTWGAGTSAGLASSLVGPTALTGYTPTLTADTGYQWQRITVSGASAPLTITQSTAWTPVAGNRYRVALAYRNGQSIGNNRRMQIYVRHWHGGTEDTYYPLTGPIGLSRNLTDSVLMAEYKAPAGATQAQMVFLTPQENGWHEWARPRVTDMDALAAMTT